jgi:hypothetical protein
MSEWKPIETAPRDGTEILTVRLEHGRPMMQVGRWDKNFCGSGWYKEFGWMIPGYQGLAHDAISPPPTLWMSLPAAPDVNDMRDKRTFEEVNGLPPRVKMKPKLRARSAVVVTHHNRGDNNDTVWLGGGGASGDCVHHPAIGGNGRLDVDAS